MSFIEDLLKRTAALAEEACRVGPTKGAYGNGVGGNKFSKACARHRADHSNPGGVVSEFFREKRTRLE